MCYLFDHTSTQLLTTCEIYCTWSVDITSGAYTPDTYCTPVYVRYRQQQKYGVRLLGSCTVARSPFHAPFSALTSSSTEKVTPCSPLTSDRRVSGDHVPQLHVREGVQPPPRSSPTETHFNHNDGVPRVFLVKRVSRGGCSEGVSFSREKLRRRRCCWWSWCWRRCGQRYSCMSGGSHFHQVCTDTVLLSLSAASPSLPNTSRWFKVEISGENSQYCHKHCEFYELQAENILQ